MGSPSISDEAVLEEIRKAEAMEHVGPGGPELRQYGPL